MKAENKPFYKVVGAIIKRRRLEFGLTVGQLSKLVDEQHATIKHIEAGKPFMLHHLMWMDQELNIGIEDIYNYREINSGKEETKGITRLDDLI